MLPEPCQPPGGTFPKGAAALDTPNLADIHCPSAQTLCPPGQALFLVGGNKDTSRYPPKPQHP